MTETIGLALDALVVVLLAATIVYAAILNRRLMRLRNHREELDAATRSFAEAAGRADAGIQGLRGAAEEAGRDLQGRVDRAAALRDELAFLCETAEAMAGRLEGAAGAVGRQARKAAEGESEAAAAPPRPRRDAPARGRGEEILKAIETLR
jgi:hypothetical protein